MDIVCRWDVALSFLGHFNDVGCDGFDGCAFGVGEIIKVAIGIFFAIRHHDFATDRAFFAMHNDAFDDEFGGRGGVHLR